MFRLARFLRAPRSPRGHHLLRPVALAILPVLAASAHAAGENAPPGLAGSVAQMLFGLVIVIALLLLTLWLIKRLSVPRGAAAGLKVLGGVPVGPRERVVLVEVAGTVLVLGVTNTQVRTLHTLDASQLPGLADGVPGVPAANDFSSWLKQSLERRKNAD